MNRKAVFTVLAALILYAVVPGLMFRIFATVGVVVAGFAASLWLMGGLVEVQTGRFHRRVRVDPAADPRWMSERVSE